MKKREKSDGGWDSSTVNALLLILHFDCIMVYFKTYSECQFTVSQQYFFVFSFCKKHYLNTDLSNFAFGLWAWSDSNLIDFYTSWSAHPPTECLPVNTKESKTVVNIKVVASRLFLKNGKHAYYLNKDFQCSCRSRSVHVPKFCSELLSRNCLVTITITKHYLSMRWDTFW